MSSTWKGKYGPLLIAEIGGNHEGDMEYARRLTNLAIESGADYVKFQLYSGDTLVSRLENPQRNKHFKKFELSKDNYIELAEACKSQGVGFMASVWDPAYFEWIDPYMNIYKIGSGDLTAYPVLRETALMKKPILLSTGLANQNEVEKSVRYLQGLDKRYLSGDYLAVLQCTSMYPIPARDANLAVMNAYRSALQLPVGYSDHTEGSKALITAVAMGAEILEFHFTDSREGKEFRDHKVSLTIDEVKELISEILQIEELKGNSKKEPLDIEADHVVSFRRSLYPKFDLPKGTTLDENNLIALRPNTGIDAREFENILGKKTKIDLTAHQKMSWEMLE
ncbi:MAG TPA: N-acetylneuraminate synthase [Flavobacteriales bacterium]|jgi:N,N'-diacetyllegionaminate synthase|nr:N-acetylneuraminate synthase [Flavobacteriales bacterium]